jgi:hypothetical protein
MRRVALLALLALALPTAALATSVTDYEGFADLSHPATVTGSVSSGSLSVSFSELSINGAAVGAGTVTISITTAANGNITGGTVNVWNSSNVSLFQGTFSSGTASQTNGTLTISGITTGGVTVAGLVNVNGSTWVGSSETVVTPEPGTLGLLGTGLVGLAGIIRRKVRS